MDKGAIGFVVIWAMREKELEFGSYHGYVLSETLASRLGS